MYALLSDWDAGRRGASEGCDNDGWRCVPAMLWATGAGVMILAKTGNTALTLIATNITVQTIRKIFQAVIGLAFAVQVSIN